MKFTLFRNPIAYIFIGLIGMVLVNIVARSNQFSWLQNDLFLGFCNGVFVGMQLLGVYFFMLKKSRKPI